MQGRVPTSRMLLSAVPSQSAGAWQADGAPSGDVVEIPLLLEAVHAAALEQLAFRRGMTTGELLRTLVRDTLRKAPLLAPGDEA